MSDEFTFFLRINKEVITIRLLLPSVFTELLVNGVRVYTVVTDEYLSVGLRGSINTGICYRRLRRTVLYESNMNSCTVGFPGKSPARISSLAFLFGAISCLVFPMAIGQGKTILYQ